LDSFQRERRKLNLKNNFALEGCSKWRVSDIKGICCSSMLIILLIEMFSLLQVPELTCPRVFKVRMVRWLPEHGLGTGDDFGANDVSIHGLY